MLDGTRAAELAAKLDVHVHAITICLPCLSFVAFPLDDGDERELRRATLHFTPILWEEGLAEPAREALERARQRGLKDAERAVADVEARGARTTIARAIVCVLALQLVAEMRARLN
jgi:imidazolonepropionase-like amidohydrolase